MLTGITAASGAGSGSNVNAEIAKIQRQITGIQEQMREKQSLLISTPEGELRRSLQQQLEAMANQIAMLQAQLNTLRMSGAQQSAMAQLGEADSPSDGGKSERVRVNANGVSIGGLLHAKA